MVSLGVPFLDSEFRSYFSYTSPLTDLKSVQKQVQEFQQYLDQDKYSFLIIHDTFKTEWKSEKGVRMRIQEVNNNIKKVLDGMGNETLFIAIGNKGA